MCGIVVGLSVGKLNKIKEKVRQSMLQYFTTELLLETEDRGKDATGGVVMFDNGNFVGMKRGDKVSSVLAKFGTDKEYYGSLIEIWKRYNADGTPGLIYLGHCRQGTSGDKEDNNNNHPIKIGNLVGIHNGIIKNDDLIFKNLGCKRDGEVDSESIFRLFEYFSNEGKEPFTVDMIKEVSNRMEGEYAVVLFNGDNPWQIPIMRSGRPIEMVFLKRYGILLLVSDKNFWSRAHFRYERFVRYYDHKLPTLIDTDDDIIIESLPDNHCMIIDLNTKITEDTTIDDLGEDEGLSTTGKKWQKPSTTTRYGNSYGHPTYPTYRAADKDKMRVFNNLSKQYEVKEGDEELDDNKSAIVSVKKEDKTKTTPTPIAKIKTKTDTEKLEEENKDAKEATRSGPLKVNDASDYTVKKDEENIIDVDSEDIREITEGDEHMDLTEVDVNMDADLAQFRAEAERAYGELPSGERGYKDIEDMLSKLEVKDKETAEGFGMLFLANRARADTWKDGYVHCLKDMMVEDFSNVKAEKAKRRESHIRVLKKALMIMVELFNEDKTASDTYKHVKNQKLATIAMRHKIDDKISDLRSVFNTYERDKISEVSTIMKNAAKYAKAGGGKKENEG